ncbi:MAG: corB [Gammaproteobacteria bacterium]|nr:corB [Gammaproteobacteria bacterium]
MSITFLVVSLILLILFSSFSSAAETAMMALNRYRLRHLVKKKHKAAVRIADLLKQPDKLLATILIGNTLANMLASAITTILALHFFGELAVLPITLLLALCVLIFGEITPKTLAVLYPERIAFLTSWPLLLLMKISYPLVWFTSMFVNGFLLIFRIKVGEKRTDDLTGEEVRTLVYESASQLAMSSKSMMLGVLDLGGVTVYDIKVPKNDVKGINIDESWENILAQLATAEHTRLPIYSGSIDNVKGMLHLKKALNLAAKNKLDKKSLLKIAEEVYFILESTSLNTQLLNFRQQKKRIGLVVDEYGDIEGLVTLEDILEEIVGEFTTDVSETHKKITRDKDGSFIVDGSITIRELNRRMQWQFSTTGPVTLSGMIIEYLETIPDACLCLTLEEYHIEVMQVEENMVKKARVWAVDVKN